MSRRLYGRPVLRRLLIQPTDPEQLACERVAFFQRRITALIFPFRVGRRRESAYPFLFYDSAPAKMASLNSPGFFPAANDLPRVSKERPERRRQLA